MLIATSAASAGERVVIGSTGGAYDRALKAAWFDPFTQKTGIEVVVVSGTNAELRAKASAMVKSENVTWDLYLDGEIQAASEAHKSVTDDLTEFCIPYKPRKDLPANACDASGALVQSTATLLVYRADAAGVEDPQTWTDMWDTKRFPGGRAFPNFDDPWRVLAAALLADGVEKDKLFPLDVERAFRKLDEIRDSVTLWWKSGDQSVQGFRNGEYDLGQIWLTRAKAMADEGLPIKWSYKASFLVGDRVALIRGAPNRENALKLIAYWLDNPAAQAKACNALSCTPPSSDAIALMSEEARGSMPTTAEISQDLVVPDAAWINANAPTLLEQWNDWVR
ncbi:ABC transporter substrate-binding protein [Pararhizobium arenae]|uniref:ABC transporter substrate-binding protein n=1 Tax=Pararhizobium arenae TaxID=1856850 RepID=UPI001FDAA9A8|nr:ABC transporter substrate-binding protein [Pararhizobium arenae]